MTKHIFFRAGSDSSIAPSWISILIHTILNFCAELCNKIANTYVHLIALNIPD